MFKKDLQNRLKNIFDLPVRFEAPDFDALEQDVLFVEIHRCRPRVQGERITDKVSGQLMVFSQQENWTFGMFTKSVERAEARYTKNFFFFEMDTVMPDSPARLQNLQEIRSAFVFLFDSQYDPDKGSLTSLEIME